ncbi:MAG: hypothetical protein ACKV19_05445 [Verrucomicrobiales bacterium]
MNAAILEIARQFAPPPTNLQIGRIEDDYGKTEHAALFIDHHDPEAVDQEELDYYSDVWFHLDTRSLLFYMYPVLRAVAEGKADQFVDYYFSCFQIWWPVIRKELSDEQVMEVHRALRDLFEQHPDVTDWEELALTGFMD